MKAATIAIAIAIETAIATAAAAWLAAAAHAGEPAGTPGDWPEPVMGDMAFGMLAADRLEAGFGDGADIYRWDVQGWYGGDRHRWRVKSEGEGEFGQSPDAAELQLLFGRMFAPFWDWQIGVRHDFRPRPDRTHLVLGVQGVAPYEFEIDTALFLSDKGDVSARLEAEYELRMTQRLVLEPRVELNAALSDERESGLSDGITSTGLGLRLRYELERELAPYVGIAREQYHGGTADLARAAGEPTSLTSVVIGLRAWF